MPINLDRPPSPRPNPPPTGRLPQPLAIYKPPVTPIYPLPIPPPKIPPPPSFSNFPSALRGFTPKALSAAKAAGSFKSPPGVGAVARRFGGFAGRAVPGIGWAFFALDAFLLSCAAGLLPGSICPRPDNPKPGGDSPGFSGGQCCDIDYKVVIQSIYTDGRAVVETTLPQVFQGSILGLFTFTVPQPNGTIRVITELRWRKCDGRVLTQSTAQDNSPRTIFQKIIRVYPAYGVPDICGDPQPVPQPRELPDQINNLNITNNNINLNITIPSPAPPSPLPKKAPLVLAPPAPLPDIIFNTNNNFFGTAGDMGDQDFNYAPAVYFNPGGGSNYNDFPDYFNNFPPAPQPQLRNPDPFPKQNPPVGGSLSLNLPPEVPPPLPDKLPPDATESDKYQFRQNKEILDKLYKANSEILDIQSILIKQDKILDNLQKLLDFEVEGSEIIKRCDDLEIVYSYKEKILPAINRQLSHVKSIEQIILDEVCEIENSAVVASPEWWQVRIQGDIPQIVLIFRFINTRTYHKLVVPHPINTNKLVTPPIPRYKKGNWQGEIVNVDNTKFLCNCQSKEEAIRVTAIAASLIQPIFLGDPVRRYYAERKGHEVSPGDMVATSAMFFPTGQRQMRPEWRVAFTRDGK